MFRVDAGSGVPIYRQLVEQVRREVMLGRLQPGAQLPR
jgi:GntR family transcriptional regulator